MNTTRKTNLLHFTTGGHTFAPVMEYLFVTSDGFAVLVDELHPWFLERTRDTQDKQPRLCFSVDSKKHQSAPYPHDYHIDHEREYYSIKFRIFTAANVKVAYQEAMKRIVKLPIKIPNERFVRKPIWNNFWVDLKADKTSIENSKSKLT